MKEPVKFNKYSGKVFRVFSTVYPTQDLLDDILPQDKDREIVKAFYYSGEIPDTMPRKERIFHRSIRPKIQREISDKFNPEKWYESRYSDGTWGVLYTAESEGTALKESLYHRRNSFFKEELSQKAVVVDLNSATLHLESSQCVALKSLRNVSQKKLTSSDKSGYPYCEKLAKKLRGQGAELLKAPSARDHDGVCVPIFNPEIIQYDSGPIKPLKCILRDEATEVFSGGEIIHQLS